MMNEKALKQFRNYLLNERNLAVNTANSYLRDLNQFIDFIKENPIVEANSEEVGEYISDLRDKGLSVTSTNRKLSALKTFFRFSMKKGWSEYNVAENIEGGKVPKRLPKPIDHDDLDLLFSKVDNLRDKVMLEFLYGTGVRRFELAKIKVRDINFKQGSIRVIGKGDKERIIPVHEQALHLAKALAEQHKNKWLFPSRKDKTNHISIRRVNATIEKWALAAGLSDKDITPHKFRHSFCSHLYERGADLKVIQELAGHENPNTTNIYTKLSNKRNFEAYAQFHPRSMQA